jgi:hypothetical protein
MPPTPPSNVILDNRIHRTLPISTAATGLINLALPASNYKVYLTTDATNTNDIITITTPTNTVYTINCTNTYKAPACGTLIPDVTNGSAQWEMYVDPTLYRIIEVRQNICDPADFILFPVSFGDFKNPASSHALVFAKTAGAALTAIPVGPVKVPPQMG